MSTDAVRAALAELVALKDLKKDADGYMAAGPWLFSDAHCAKLAEYERRKPLAWAAARAALSEPEPGVGATRDDGMPARAPERYLRRLLAYRVSLPHAYYDDGEAHGAEHGISIDFMREPVADIDAKLRALNVARAECAAAQSPAMPVEPDTQLCTFYGVYTFPALVEAMEHHIKKLQAKLPQNDMPAATKTRFA